MEEEKKRLLKNIKMQCRIETIKQDNEVLDFIEENIFEIYSLEPKFIVRRYSRLKQIVESSNCLDNEKCEMLNFISKAHSKLIEEKKNIYSALLEQF